jgi:hypothetical protein
MTGKMEGGKVEVLWFTSKHMCEVTEENHDTTHLWFKPCQLECESPFCAKSTRLD